MDSADRRLKKGTPPHHRIGQLAPGGRRPGRGVSALLRFCTKPSPNCHLNCHPPRKSGLSAAWSGERRSGLAITTTLPLTTTTLLILATRSVLPHDLYHAAEGPVVASYPRPGHDFPVHFSSFGSTVPGRSWQCYGRRSGRRYALPYYALHPGEHHKSSPCFPLTCIPQRSPVSPW